MATARDLAEDARRVAVQTQELYLSLGESREHQSQPRTSIPEPAGHDGPHSAPKSETVTRRLRTKTSSTCLFSSAAPTIAFLGMQGVGKRTTGCKRHFRLAWQPPDLYQGPAGAAGAGWVWKELSQVADPSFFLYLQR